jgi:hypothetical protein
MGIDSWGADGGDSEGLAAGRRSWVARTGRVGFTLAGFWDS